MRKKHLFIPTIVIIVLGLFYYFNAPSKQNIRKKILSVSSEDIIQQHLNKKIERRKNGYSKPADKPDKYIEYKNAMVSGFGKAKYPKNYKFKELKSAFAHKASLKSTTADLGWVQRGPGNIGGRTRSILVDPSDATKQTWFAGAVAGGIWKTTDAGTTWELVSSDLPNLSISTLAMASSNSDVIYAGTGEGYYNLDAIQGNGVYKSIDHGVSWSQISKTTNTSYFYYVNSIVVSPTDENILYVATNKALTKSSDGGSNWSNITPKQGGEGRYQHIIMHPSNENILWAALNNVGVFKSMDAGESWYQVLDLNGEYRVELAVSPTDPDILYALNQDSKLYYSSNGGDDWSECVDAASTDFLGQQGWYNNVIKVNPEDSDNGFIGGVDFYSFSLGDDISGTSKYAFKLSNEMSSIIKLGNFYGTHENGGLKVYDAYSFIEDVEVQFGTGVTQKAHRLTTTSYTGDISEDITSLSYNDYVDVPFKVVKTDGTNSDQLEASFIDSNENGIFDLTTDGYEVIVVHNLSYDGTQANTSVSTNNGYSNLLFCLYPTLVDGVSWDEASLPTNNIVISPFLMSNRELTSDHLTTWSSPSATNYSHADHHSINILTGIGSPFAIIDGNDGGVFYSEDGGTNWVSKSSGYITTQFYGITRHPSEYRYLGGMQDNGSYLSGLDPSVLDDWQAVLSGDGFDAVWHYRNPEKIIGSVYNNDLARSDDGGASWYDLSSGIGDNTSTTAPFLTKIASSKLNPDLLFVGGESGLWRSENFGTNWENIIMGTNWGWGDDGGYPKISISEANADIVWAGIIMNSSDGYTKGTMHVSTDGGQSFSNTVNAMDLGAVSNIATHPSDPNTAYLLFSYAYYPKVFRTTDLGQTWEDITGFNQDDGAGNITYGADYSSNGFPNVAVNSLLVMPFDENEIWVGTEIGLFISYDNGVTWAIADNGIPAVSIWDMKIVGDEIIVGTHGLGVWTVQRSGLTNTNYYPYISNIGVKPKGNYLLELDYDVVYDKVEIYADDILLLTYDNTIIGVKQYELEETNVAGKDRIRVIGYIGEQVYSSNSVEIPVNNLSSILTSYSNKFTTQLGDFYGNGFSVNKIDLDNNALTTAHPYIENKDIYSTLQYPIIVSTDESMAFLKYIDIAYIETGETGTAYPESDFYDYVVVEATKDGINWLPLADGYDYSYSDTWTSNSSSYSDTPTTDQYVQHDINLWDTFAAEDTIIVRFKLHSDQLEAGWGWAIDNLEIQEEASGIFSKSAQDFEFNLFPNPAINNVNIIVDDVYVGDIKMSLYSTSGKLQKQITSFKDSQNFKSQMNIASLASGNYIIEISMGENKSSQLLTVK